MKDALRFLKLLSARVPPIYPTRHGLILHDDGRLSVTMSAFWPFILDEQDMEIAPEKLVDDLARMWGMIPESEKRIPDEEHQRGA